MRLFRPFTLFTRLPVDLRNQQPKGYAVHHFQRERVRKEQGIPPVLPPSRVGVTEGNVLGVAYLQQSWKKRTRRESDDDPQMIIIRFQSDE
mmetsp:Transcript_8463/g.14014  ORF Transcript_8463/g.14014 Transcript_8463/m.14014 type:complete len:91 (-) Transcript_8463:237-509(-)